MSKVKTYIISILIPVALGGLVGFLISGSMNYDQLNQPPLSPPGILFPIVWQSAAAFSPRDTIPHRLVNFIYLNGRVVRNVKDKGACG